MVSKSVGASQIKQGLAHFAAGVGAPRLAALLLHNIQAVKK
jgi:hypothetical protein